MGLPFVFLLIFSVLSPHAPHLLKRPCYPLLGLCLVNRTKGNFFYPFILQTPDFYVQMKWEFTSWVPLVSRICPNDFCCIWKSGAKLCVDLALLGFDTMS